MVASAMSGEASEIARLRAELAAAKVRATAAEAELAQAKAVLSASEAMISHLKLEIAKLRRAQYGQRSERRARLIEQLELQLEELETAATEDAIAAEVAARKTTTVRAFERRKPVRKPFPDQLPRERVVVEAPTSCACCGPGRIVKSDREDGRGQRAIERHWFENNGERDARSRAAPVEGDPDGAREVHLPGLREDQPAAGAIPCHSAGVGWSQPHRHDRLRERAFVRHWSEDNGERSAPAVEPAGRALRPGGCRAQPLHAGRPRRPRHRRAGTAAHPDRPAGARGRPPARRRHHPCRFWPGAAPGPHGLWTYVRDDRPFAGGAPPAALFFFSPDREKTHPNKHLAGWQGVLQADAYGGYNDLYRADRDPGPVISALCWSHARRKFFELADIVGNARKGRPAYEISPLALEAVTQHRRALRHRALHERAVL